MSKEVTEIFVFLSYSMRLVNEAKSLLHFLVMAPCMGSHVTNKTQDYR